MSVHELHELLSQLKRERNSADLVDSEYQQRLDEIVESLEQQKLYPDTYDQYSSLSEQVRELILDYQAEHPTIQAVLDSVHRLLDNFKS
ncbi:MAG: DUF4404 family protein [Gammaproteobacteria bacterium]|nr:DUF4404 family protein [Gammaproteobacteria bacterium]